MVSHSYGDRVHIVFVQVRVVAAFESGSCAIGSGSAGSLTLISTNSHPIFHIHIRASSKVYLVLTLSFTLRNLDLADFDVVSE
jgi:hypothetical protein